MMRTRLASSRSVGFSPNALTRVVMFFLASGRDMARITGLRGLRRKRAISCAQPHQAPGDVEEVLREDRAVSKVLGFRVQGLRLSSVLSPHWC